MKQERRPHLPPGNQPVDGFPHLPVVSPGMAHLDLRFLCVIIARRLAAGSPVIMIAEQANPPTEQTR